MSTSTVLVENEDSIIEERIKIVYLEIGEANEPSPIDFNLFYKNHRIVHTEKISLSRSMTSKDQFKILEQGLKNSIPIAVQAQAKLLFSSFDPFSPDASLSLLELLYDSGLSFEFHGFSAFDDPKMLKCYIDIIKKKRAYRKGDAQDGKRGNYEHVGAHLATEEIKSHSILKKRQKKLLDANKVNAQLKLKELQDQGNYSLIARELNGSGILTARGKQHTAKSVSRLLEDRANLKNNFTEDSILESQLAAALGPAAETESAAKVTNKIPLDWGGSNETRNFNNEITFTFSEPLLEEIQLSFYRTSEEKNPFQYALGAGKKHCIIDVYRDTPLLPGRYYVCLQGQKIYKERWIAITLFGVYQD